ncbi:MAG TPA: DUF1570 domain-containing protein [Pirellulaceae bacterium]|jgi:hypothetical protein
MRRLFYLILVAALGSLIAGWLSAAEPLIKLEIAGRLLEGMPLAISEKKIFFLARDGQLTEFAPTEASNYSRLDGSFRGYSQAEMRGLLLREFPQFEVSGIGHYLVVHPAGKRDQWAPRFEELYRSFQQYFSARGWQLSEPKFPLVAIVFPRQVDFWQAAAREGYEPNPGLLGYYSPLSNRIMMFDAAASRPGWDWTTNSDTIIHEAAHQTAFNTGVHQRFAQSPRWLVEGLGTLFEARGVWQSRTYQSQSDRINRGRLTTWQSLAKSRRPTDIIAQLVSSDRFFARDPEAAYAEAWALSFYLIETSPKKYIELLNKTANRPLFAEYPSAKRLEDFTSVFGTDFAMLDARLQRFIAGLK